MKKWLLLVGILLSTVFLSSSVSALSPSEGKPWVYDRDQLTFTLGEYAEDVELKPSQKIVKRDGKSYVEWTYTVKSTVTGTTGYPDTVERYFSTTKDSGLGMPEIISVNGAGIIADGSQTVNSDLLYTTRHLVNKPNKTGETVYKIQTPIVAYRDNYVLDAGVVLKKQHKKGEKFTLNGKTYTSDKDRVFEATQTIRESADRYWLDTLPYDTEKHPVLHSAHVNNTVVAGDYISTDTIKWVTSFNNTYESSKFVKLDLTPDASQAPKGAMTVYFYKPSNNGYALDESKTMTVNGTTLDIDEVPAGYIVQAVLETTITDATKDHSITSAENASLESLYANLTIEKTWQADAERVDTSYTLNGGTYKDHQITLPALEDKVEEVNVPKFKIDAGKPATEWTRTTYDVQENIPAGYTLNYKGNDRYHLNYFFDNKKISATPNVPSPNPETSFGVTSLHPLEINSYWYGVANNPSGKEWYGYGGNLAGTFRVPAGAKPGDHFTLTIPKEVIYEQAVSANKIGDILSSSGQKIGEMFQTAPGVIDFVLQTEIPDQTEGQFIIGNSVSKTAPSYVSHINTVPTQPDKNYPIGFVPNPALFYDPNNPNALQQIRKNLTFETAYNNGETTNIPNDVLVHYEDKDIKNAKSQVTKLAIAEDKDTITWQISWNAENQKLHNESQFIDLLTNTIELVGGNDQNGLNQSVELFVSNVGTVTGHAPEASMRKIWPNVAPPDGVTVYDVRVENINQPSDVAGLNFTQQLVFDVDNLGTKTLIARIKTRKIAPNGGQYHNIAEYNWYRYPNRVIRDRRYEQVFHHEKYAAKYGLGALSEVPKKGFSLDKVDTNYQPIKNNPASFTIYGISDDSQYKNTYVAQTVSTDENGRVTFTDLPYGDYKVREIVPPSGYTLTAKEFTVSVTDAGVTVKDTSLMPNGDGKISDTNIPRIVNDKADTELLIKKVDAAGHNPLKGAGFKLERVEDSGITLIADIPADRGLSEFSFVGLSPGLYKLTETQAPAGYRPIEEQYFDVKTDPATSEQVIYWRKGGFGDLVGEKLENKEKVFSFEAVNKKPGLGFNKTDTSNIPLQDPWGVTKFNLYMEYTDPSRFVAGAETIEVVSNTGEKKVLAKVHRNLLINAKDEWGGTVEAWEKTVPNGAFDFGLVAPDTPLPDGHYYVVETVTMDEYIQPDKPVATFEIRDGALVGSPRNITIINYKKAEFVIRKVDADGNALPNAEFTLYQEDKKTPVDAEITANPFTTTGDGLAGFKNLSPGTYYLKETKAPSGYKLLDDYYTVSVDSFGEVVIRQENGTILSKINAQNQFEIKIVNKKDKPKFAFKKKASLENGFIDIQTILIDGKQDYPEAVFKLINDATGESLGEVKQKVNETFVFDNLEAGSYTLEEVTPPSGFIKEDKVYKVLVGKDNSTHLLILDKKQKDSETANVPNLVPIIDPILVTSPYGVLPLEQLIDNDSATGVTWDRTDLGNTLNSSAQIGFNENNIRVGTYVGVDLGKNTVISDVVFDQGSENHTDRMKAFDLEYSLDGQVWMKYKSYTEKEAPTGDISESNIALYARYIRFTNASPVLNQWLEVREIQVKEYTSQPQTITSEMQQDLSNAANIATIGNTEKPKLILEKLDGKTKAIITGKLGLFKDYTAKFSLYKVSDTKEDIKSDDKELITENRIQEFLLKDGAVETEVAVTKLGRYALVEDEAPKNYAKINPILLDLVETIRVDEQGNRRRSVKWELVKNSPKYVTIDNTQLAQAKVKIKVENFKNEYPSTGGKGIQYFIIIGSFVVAAGLYAHHRQNNKRYRRRRRH